MRSITAMPGDMRCLHTYHFKMSNFPSKGPPPSTVPFWIVPILKMMRTSPNLDVPPSKFEYCFSGLKIPLVSMIYPGLKYMVDPITYVVRTPPSDLHCILQYRTLSKVLLPSQVHTPIWKLSSCDLHSTIQFIACTPQVGSGSLVTYIPPSSL